MPTVTRDNRRQGARCLGSALGGLSSSSSISNCGERYGPNGFRNDSRPYAIRTRSSLSTGRRRGSLARGRWAPGR
jgi:hypothetical protein